MAVRILTALFVAIVIVLHVVRRDVSPLHRGISRFASSGTLLAMTVAFAALAAALGLAAWSMRSWLLAVAAVSMALVAMTPDSDRLSSTGSVVHTAAAFVFFVAAAAG